MKREIYRAIALLSITSLLASSVIADEGNGRLLRGQNLESSEGEEDEAKFWEMRYWTAENVKSAAKVVVPTALLAAVIAWKLKATKKPGNKLEIEAKGDGTERIVLDPPETTGRVATTPNDQAGDGKADSQ